MLNGLKHPAAGLIEVPLFPSAADAPLESGGGGGAPSLQTPSAGHTVETDQIDQVLTAGLFWLRFPQALESRFQIDLAEERLRHMLVTGAMVAVLFNLMLISDSLMVPDVFESALKLRLFVFTPCTIVGLLLFAKVNSAAAREWGKVVMGLAACCISLYLCVASHDRLAGPYLVALVPIVMFSNAVVQMRFVQALFMDCMVLVVFAIGLIFVPNELSIEIMIPSGLTLISTVVFTLYGCYILERDDRRNWLLHLREKLLLEDLKDANQHLDSLSRSDMLTGVANRRHFDEFLQHVWERARLDGSEISLMMIDVDHFKAYNDRYGHPEGDACLKEVAATLKRRLRRPGDLIARYGGEEFIAILTGTPLATAAGAAERVRKGVENLNRLHAVSSTHAVVTVSVGVACLRPNAPHSSPAQLISAADEALYQAKSRGRNRVFTFGTSD